MVGARPGPAEDLEPAPMAMGCLAHELLELGLADEAGAGAGDKEASGGHEMEREDVEVVVLLQAVGHVLLVTPLDELGRVAQDDVPGRAVALHLAGP